MSNKTQPHAFPTHSTGTFVSQWHSHIQAEWFAGGIAGRLRLGHTAEEPMCHAATGISRAARWYRITVNMLILSLFLLRQTRDHDQSNRDNTEREGLGGLDGQKADGFNMGKVRLSEVLLKILPTIANAANHVLARSLPHAFKSTALNYFQS